MAMLHVLTSFCNRNDEEGGFVSLFLRNDNSIQMEVYCFTGEILLLPELGEDVISQFPSCHDLNFHYQFLVARDNFMVQVMCQFTLGVKNAFKHHFSFNKINPNSGYGFPKMYSHEQINAKEVLKFELMSVKSKDP